MEMLHLFSLGSSDSKGPHMAFREGLDYMIEKPPYMDGRYVILQTNV